MASLPDDLWHYVCDEFLGPRERALMRRVSRVTSTPERPTDRLEVELSRDARGVGLTPAQTLELARFVLTLRADMPCPVRVQITTSPCEDVWEYTRTGNAVIDFLSRFLDKHIVPKYNLLHDYYALEISGNNPITLSAEYDRGTPHALALDVSKSRKRRRTQ